MIGWILFTLLLGLLIGFILGVAFDVYSQLLGLREKGYKKMEDLPKADPIEKMLKQTKDTKS